MVKHLSDERMLELLKKVQDIQIRILGTGRSAHLDASVSRTIFGTSSPYISFDLNIFENNDLIESFEFSAIDTEDELEYEYKRLLLLTEKLLK